MSTHLLGTNATNSLVSVKFLPGLGSGLSAADIATMAQLIKDDIVNTHPVVPSAFASDGLVYLPQNRGIIKCLPGDLLAVDAATGWPIVVSARALAAGPYTFV